MTEKISRRRFLKIGGGVAISLVALGGIGGFVATRSPEVADVEKEMKGTSPKKILVTYATRAGSSIEVAVAIGEVLSAAGATVDVRPVRNVQSAEGYDAVVIGSAIRIGAWLPEATEFVQKNKQTLAKIPTAYFVVSGYLRNDTPEMRKTVDSYVDPVRQIVEPSSVGLFAGKIDYNTLSILDKTMAQTMGEKEGDWRNWDQIRGWAREIQPVLMKA